MNRFQVFCVAPGALRPLFPLQRRPGRLLLRRGPQRPQLPGRSSLNVHASFNSSNWPPLPQPDIEAWSKAAVKHVTPAIKVVAAALNALWAAQRRLVYQTWARAAVATTLCLGIITAAANAWGLPAINQRVPQAAQQVAAILKRDVRIGGVKWIAPTGILGFHPLLSVGPVHVGAGHVERSFTTVDEIKLRVDPLQSIARGRVVLALQAAGAEVHLHQAENLSWFGFPDDTLPSSREFLPGLRQQGSSGSDAQQGRGSSRRGGGNGGGIDAGGSGARQSSASSQAAPPSTGAPTKTFTSLPSNGTIAEHSTNAGKESSFLHGIASLLLDWHAAQNQEALDALVLKDFSGGYDPLGRIQQRPDVLLMSVGSPNGSAGINHSVASMESPPLAKNAGNDGWRPIFKLNPFARHGTKNSRSTLDKSGSNQATTSAQVHNNDDVRKRQLHALNSIELASHREDTRKFATTLHHVDEVEKDTSEINPLHHETETAAVDNDVISRTDIVPGRPDNAQEVILEQSTGDLHKDAENDDSIDAIPSLTVDTSVGMEPASLGNETGAHATPILRSNVGAALLNRLPTLRMELRKEGSAGISAPSSKTTDPDVQQPRPPSTAVMSLNTLQPLERTFATINSDNDDPKSAQFAEIVVDQATVRRQMLGSHALQRARNWQPARPLKGNKPAEAYDMQSFEVQEGALPPLKAAFRAKGAEYAQQMTGMALKDDEAMHVPAAHESHNGEHAHRLNSGGRFHMTHPGYFPSSPGPVYTPAPPEALAARRAKHRGMFDLLERCGQALAAQLQRSLVLGQIDLHNAVLYGHIHGEASPRVFENVTAKLRLGPQYDSLSLDISASPHERDTSSSKCTMRGPHAHRHLRDFTGVHALRHPEASNASENPQTPQETSMEGSQASELTVDPTATTDMRAMPPTGGHVRVLVKAKGLLENELATGGTKIPDLSITICGKNLHAPLIERIVELPMDIDGGRLNGDFIIKSHDVATWRYPEFHGRVEVKDAQFHFWDATDDIFDADLDLVFERDRLYLHRAKGRFGAVPMTLTGDMDLDPLTGFYRLSAAVPQVEVNSLRATLGVRPTPFPVVGAVGGTLHISGPLEKPVFSGKATVTRPTPEMLLNCEPTAALEALQAEPAAVAAYDRVAFGEAELIFSLDTESNIMSLHSMHADPVEGGRLRGHGTMNVAPSAEMEPDALDIVATGTSLPADEIARRYLPQGTQLPPDVIDRPASVTATMRGAHLSPVFDVAFALPDGGASGTAKLTRDSTAFTFASPVLDASGCIMLNPPSYEAIKEALTQQQATALAKPNLNGCSADVMFKGFDVLPLTSNEESMRQLAQQSGEPVRLKLNGRTRISGSVVAPLQKLSSSEMTPVDATAEKESGGAMEQGERTESPIDHASWQFNGTLDLEEFKLNQLKLYRGLKGTLLVSESGVAVHARGLRPDEALDIELTLPLLPEWDEGIVLLQSPDANANTRKSSNASNPRRCGSSMSMRCGQLTAAAKLDATGSLVDVRVANVKLDELELASLRGDLQEVSCSLNFDTQTGRGRVNLLAPRYSGLGGESLSGGFRWERDVVRLEKLILQQKNSRYEVQGEYVIPPTVAMPTSTSDLARQRRQDAGLDQSSTGRWRMRVDVPSADMQEILPAARLLQNAASRAPADYGRAKAAFIDALQQFQLAMQDLNTQLMVLAESEVPQSVREDTSRAVHAASTHSGSLHLPGLQDVRGIWSGSVQAFGGGSGATSCEFDVRGQGWRWGETSPGLEAVVAKGSYHSEEGVQLQEFVLKSGDAKLLVRGSLLSDHQDASVLLTDFPLATLRPLFRAVPALQHAAPAVSPAVPEPVSSPLPLGLLANAVSRASEDLAKAGPDADSPIAGMLYVSGNLGGSQAKPTGEVAVRVYDAAVGTTRLAQAQASARLADNMQLSFNVDIIPVEGHRKSGHVRAAGTIPLSCLDRGNTASSGEAEAIADVDAGKSSQSPLDVRLSVRDSGMAVLTSVTPDFRWQSGEADVSFRFTGTLDAPNVSGAARVGRAAIDCPVLKYPLEVVSADVRCEDGILDVNTLDIKSGRKGHLRARGALPIYPPGVSFGPAAAMQKVQNRMTVDINGLELRVRNAYTGQLDALLTLRDSVQRPVVGGSMRFSRGAVYLMPQGQDMGSSGTAPSGATGAGASIGPSSGPSVSKVFALLTRGEAGVAARLEDALRHEVEAVEGIMVEAAGANVTLDSLALHFGPDLRAVYPLVMNFGIAGELTLSGPATPETVDVQGVLRLPGGDVNLVAAQLELDREHVNTLTFGGPGAPSGADPLVDVVLSSGDLRVTVQGRASEWADHLVMQSVSGASAGGDAGEQLDATEAARLLEAKLKAALLADDGQLALSRLASTTVSTLLPKIETQGSVGGTRWRLVSAPAIPGLLDPLLTDPSNLLGSITMGTEAEVQFGRRLQAAMVRKLRDSNVTTQWTLNYNLSSKLRMQFSISSAPPYPKTLTFQFQSSEGS